jgi:hypothetical protein
MIPLELFLLGVAAIYLGALESAFSALMRLSLRLHAERSDAPDALAQFLDEPLRLFIPRPSPSTPRPPYKHSPPRLAFLGARVFAEAAQGDAYWWLSDIMNIHLGPMYALKLAETRLRLAREEARLPEAGAWRFRLEELLDQRPDLAPLVTQMVEGSADRLRDEP